MSQAVSQPSDQMSRVRGIDVVVSVLMLALSTAGICQTEPSDEAALLSSQTTEEIIVYGDKSMSVLRQEMNRAADITFDLFNSLNSDDEYDIHCYREAPIGSRIKRRVCRPNYEAKLTADAVREFLTGISQGGVEAKIKQKEKILQEEMEALVSEHPELQKALTEFVDAKRAVDSEHERRCEGQTLNCES